MPKATLDKLRALASRRRSRILMYGLTEAFRSTYLDPAEVDRRPDSIGKAIPNAEILVVRPDGTLCDPARRASSSTAAPLVALGYWNDPERTAERFRPAPGRDAGLANAGDRRLVGRHRVADEDGFLYFVGRSDEMIKTSGYRVSPTEIEEAAYATGLVRDAVALGVDDAAARSAHRAGRHARRTDGARRRGAASPRCGASCRSTWCRQSSSSATEIPRSPNGKFDRALLREELAS